MRSIRPGVSRPWSMGALAYSNCSARSQATPRREAPRYWRSDWRARACCIPASTKAVTWPEMLDEELKSIMASSPSVLPKADRPPDRERIGGIRCQRIGRGRQAPHGRELGGLVVRDHRVRPAGDDGVDHPQRLGFGVVPQRLGEADLARRLAEGLEALAHGGQFDFRRIDHGDLRPVDATVLGALPVAVQRVECVLAAARAEHPVEHVAAGIAGLEATVRVAVAACLSFADPAFHRPPSLRP
jgi:hypothetical protein